jgi:integrase
MQRKRKSSANRILTVLKAALNYAWTQGHGGDRDQWRRVKPFEKADAPRVKHLSRSEAIALIEAASDDFRPMVKAALFTGCRYGELCKLRVRHLYEKYVNKEKKTFLHIATSKTDKPRDVPLSPAGKEFFAELAKGRKPDAPLLTHEDGSEWGKSHQSRPMELACKAAGIEPVGFHILRHTYATLLLKSEDGSPGMSLAYVAKAIGDSVATTAKHYAHVVEDDLQSEVERKLPSFGGVK